MKKLRSIAVIGPNADCVQFGDYTWSKSKKDGVTPLQGIQKLVGKKVKVNYAKGCSIASLDTSGIDEAVHAAQQSDVAIVLWEVPVLLLCVTVQSLLPVEKVLI